MKSPALRSDSPDFSRNNRLWGSFEVEKWLQSSENGGESQGGLQGSESGSVIELVTLLVPAIVRWPHFGALRQDHVEAK